jgi:hypothetical protein
MFFISLFLALKSLNSLLVPDTRGVWLPIRNVKTSVFLEIITENTRGFKENNLIINFAIMKKCNALYILVSIGLMVSVIANAQLTHRANPIKSVDNSKLLNYFNLDSFGLIVGSIEYVPIIHSNSWKVSTLKKDTTIHLSAGELSNILTSLQKATITNLHLIGSIDARDFKTMRDSMPVLSDVDIYNVSISAYTGMQGTAGIQNTIYPANNIPQNAFLLSSNTLYSKLTSIILPTSITSIGDSAFYKCHYLTDTLTIPNSVTSIGVKAFSQCQNLIGLKLSNSLISISNDAFLGDWLLNGDLTIPNSVISIGDGAFFGCWNLTSVTIPNSVTSIGVAAFGDCKSLTGNLILPNSITSISDGAFGRCARLTGVTIPNSVISIGNNAFTMAGLTSITIPNSVITIGDWAFAFCHLTGGLAIPNSVTSIGHGAFSFTGITEFIVENENPNFKVNDGVLFDKAQTKLIIYPPNKQGIYIIPNSVASIGDYAFDYCNRLTGITIPNSVTSIGDGAFYNCSGLTSISANSSIPIDLSNSMSVFGQVNKSTCTLYVPTGSKTLYQSANQWQDFITIIEISLTGTTELTGNEQLILYPNPVTEGFYINASEELCTVSIYNSGGMQLYLTQIKSKSYIDIANLPQGLYIVKVSIPNGVFEKKFVKK